MDRTDIGTLLIPDVQLSDAGTYMCVGSNSIGSNSAPIKVTVLKGGKFAFPTSPWQPHRISRVGRRVSSVLQLDACMEDSSRLLSLSGKILTCVCVFVQRIRSPRRSPSSLPRLTSRRARVWSSTAWPLETRLLASPGPGPAGSPPTTRSVDLCRSLIQLWSRSVPQFHQSAPPGSGQPAEDPLSQRRGLWGVYLSGPGQPWQPLVPPSAGNRLRVRHLIVVTCVAIPAPAAVLGGPDQIRSWRVHMDRAVLNGGSTFCCRSPEPHHRHRAPQCRGACRGDGDLQVQGLQRSPAHQAGVESGQ